MEKDTYSRTRNRFQRQGRPATYNRSETCSSVTTCPTRASGRLLVHSANRRQRDRHRHQSVRWLCHTVLGWRKQPSTLEPFQQQRTTHQQPLKKHVNHEHQTIYILIEISYEDTTNIESNQISEAAGGTKRPISLKNKKYNSRLSTLKGRFLQD